MYSTFFSPSRESFIKIDTEHLLGVSSVRPSLNIIVTVNPSVKALTFNPFPPPCTLHVRSRLFIAIDVIYIYTVARFDQSSLGEISGALRIYIIRIKQIECKFTTHYTRSSFTGRIERGNEKRVERQRDRARRDATYYPFPLT